jgi:hypothetical protein
MRTLAVTALLLAALASAEACSSSSSPTPSASARAARVRAEVGDPVGDSQFDPRVPTSPDLKAATVELSPDGRLLLAVHLAPGTYMPETSAIQFSLDFDNGTEAAAPDHRRCGQLLVAVGSPGGKAGQATVSSLNSANGYDVVAHVPLSPVVDGLGIAVPPSLLPKGFRRILFRVVASGRLDARATTPILDSIPDTGVAVALGEP